MKKTILLLESSDFNILQISEVLIREGYEILSAGNEKDAYQLLSNNDICLIISTNNSYLNEADPFVEKIRTSLNKFYLPFLNLRPQALNKSGEPDIDYSSGESLLWPDNDSALLNKVNSLIKKSEILKSFSGKSPLSQKYTPKILIVEDEEYLRRLFSFNLQKAGFESVQASNGKEGFEAARKHKPDIILSDIMMPVTDGYAFRRMLLGDSDLKSIPFVFLTAKGGEDNILEGFDLEIEDYILKTTSTKIMIAKLNAILKSIGKEREKVVEEINQAADSMRAKVVPDSYPDFEGVLIRHYHQTFKGIPGGDFIDYFNFDDGNLAVILGDVMGKKWKAWYFAYAYAGYIRTAVRGAMQLSGTPSPAELMQKVNELIYNDSKISEVFTTLSIIILSKNPLRLRYAGAGDLPIIYKSASTGEAELVKANGLLLGLSNTTQYSDVEISLNVKDLIVMVTDGVVEARNSAKEQYGIERLRKFIGNIKQSDEPDKHIISELAAFTDHKFEDDVSLISIQVKS